MDGGGVVECGVEEGEEGVDDVVEDGVCDGELEEDGEVGEGVEEEEVSVEEGVVEGVDVWLEVGRDCFDFVDWGWCGLGWDDLRFLEGTGDDGVF